jgi:hypothetical protein
MTLLQCATSLRPEPAYPRRSTRRAPFLTAVAVATLTVGVSVGSASDRASGSAEPARPATAGERLFYNLLSTGARTVQGGRMLGAASGASKAMADSAVDYWLPGIGESAPDWAKRFEFEWDVRENVKPDFSILTVQPLYRGADDADTVFTQLRAARNHQFGDQRSTTNIGLGYRRLFLDNTLLAGVNTFYDREWSETLERFSIGGELRWSGFDLYANGYWDASGAVDVGNGVSEEPLNGRDVELTAQIPYLPWARARAKRFYWDGTDGAIDIDGWAVSGEFDISRNIQIEAGWIDDNTIDRDSFVQLRFTLASWGGHDKPVALSSRFIDDRAYRMRDMSKHTLDKVRRENEIIVQRTASGVVISRTD